MKHLSTYDFKCGKVLRIETDKYSLTMWHEHQTYNVRYVNKRETRGINDVPWTTWNVFNKISEARKDFIKWSKIANGLSETFTDRIGLT